jgi:serine/threonine-protein kinase
MNRAQWEKAKDIFEVAVDLAPANRESYLARACGQDQNLLSELKSLVRQYDEAGSFLKSNHLAVIPSRLSGPQASLSPEQILAGRFQILKLLGSGGMGEVYEAMDLRMVERIAVKVIRPDVLSTASVARLRQEVQLARRVTHSNACRVFDLEEHVFKESGKEVVFLTMELLEGLTLAERLQQAKPFKREEALGIIRQVTEALVASHAAGIIHRDLKPSNIILVGSGTTPDGVRAVVTDFGLARFCADARAKPEFPSQSLTGAGQIIGTISYMAPEQIEGKEATRATDIYALGLIMYEMMCGKKPFSDGTPLAGLVERLKGAPPFPRRHVEEIEPDLEALILACLATSPAERIQDAATIRQVLQGIIKDSSRAAERWASSSIPRLASVAVLPFVNMSPESDKVYFSDGLAEELMSALAHVEGLRVVARTSAFQFRGSGLDIREIARRLNATALVEGTVRWDSGRVRIAVQLVNGAEGYHLWSGRFDRQMEDVFTLQEEIANTITKQLKLQLKGGRNSHFVRHRTQSVEGYNLFLKGRFFWNKRTHVGLDKATEYFKLAIDLDPGFVPALAGLANCYILSGVYGTRPPQEVFSLARKTVSKALSLDPEIPEVHSAAACIDALHDWNWPSAERQFQRALKIEPSCALAHHWYATNCLMPQGRWAEASAQLQLARECEPLSLAISTTIGLELHLEGNHDGAIQEYIRVLEMDPNFGVAHFFLGQAYEQKGMFAEAIAALERSVVFSDRSAETIALLGRAYALCERLPEARNLLEELLARAAVQYVSPVLIAQLLLGLNLYDEALHRLEQAVAVRATDLTWIGVRPAFKPLWSEVRFRSICKQIGLSEHN